MKKHLLTILFGVVLGLLIGYYLVISENQNNIDFTFLNGILLSSVGVVASYFTLNISFLLDRKVPWQKNIGNRLSIGITLHFIAVSIFVFLCVRVYKAMFVSSSINNSFYIKCAILLFIVVLMYEIIYFAFYSYYAYATLQIETVKQERKQIELQLKALKSQLSPHFLFNGLNTISSLVFKDEIKAASFIRKLANMYNYTLKSYDSKLISVAKELDFVNSYLYLIQTRFDEKIDCKIKISDKYLNTKIPPLTLQMLIENAVKHNVLSEKDKLIIEIYNSKNEFIIENNITKKNKKASSFNIGLKNINERYLLLTQKGVTVTNGQNFTVKLPIIQ